MGLLRLLLALGVVAEHAGSAFGAGSYTAVQAFFVISGFYMSLILSSGRYSTPGFYKSRFFRLYPVYWTALAIALVYYAVAYTAGISTTIFTYIHEGTITALVAVYVIFSNLLILGSDLTWFNALAGWHLLLIPPVWTLSLELVFYMLCPLLMRASTKMLFTLAVAIFVARGLAYVAGLDHDPWHARFIGFEIAYFVVGIISYRIAPILSGVACYLLIGVLFVCVLAFNDLARLFPLPPLYDCPDYIHSQFLYLLLALSLPSLFALTRTSRLDQYLGEYSYPVYLVHYIFVIILVHSGVAKGWGINPALLVVLLTLGHAALLIHFVQIPIDRYRHKLFRLRKSTDRSDVRVVTERRSPATR